VKVTSFNFLDLALVPGFGGQDRSNGYFLPLLLLIPPTISAPPAPPAALQQDDARFFKGIEVV
jgi:hypothetical protein